MQQYRRFSCVTLVLSVALSLLPLCVTDAKEDSVDLDLKHRSFGKTQEDQPVTLYTLSHTSGLQVSVTDHGATLVSLKVPDRQGKLADIVLGSETLDDYLFHIINFTNPNRNLEQL